MAHPKSERAIAVTDRRIADLDTLRNAILTPGSISVDGPYDFNQRDTFVVWIELLAAYRPQFFGDPEHMNSAPILREMSKFAADVGDELMEYSERWNGSQGGANV